VTDRTVSVIIPAYNAAATIAAAISSALGEPEVGEVIVVDDASTDGTINAAGSADDGSGRLRIHGFAANRGPAAARNQALAMASLCYVALLDSDDRFVPGRFSRLLGIENGDWDFAADNVQFISDREADALGSPTAAANAITASRSVFFEEFISSNISKPLRLRSEMGFLKVVMRREVLAQFHLTYDAGLRLGEDYVFYAQALLRGARMVITSEIGYLALWRDESLSARHAMGDLEALAQADRKLIGEARARGATRLDLLALSRHLAAIELKVAVRRLLEDGQTMGRRRALWARAGRPGRLLAIFAELAKDRIAHLIDPSPSRRVLLAPADFNSG
jgi:succinoglycan biosynthesis protein ExoU